MIQRFANILRRRCGDPTVDLITIRSLWRTFVFVKLGNHGNVTNQQVSAYFVEGAILLSGSRRAYRGHQGHFREGEIWCIRKVFSATVLMVNLMSQLDIEDQLVM